MCLHKFDGPPSLSTKVIRNLGAKFCSMTEEDLSDKKLKKKNSSGCVGAKKPNKKDKNDKKKKTMMMKTSSVMENHWSARFCFLWNCWAFWSVITWQLCLTVGIWNCLFIGHDTLSFNDLSMLTHPVIGRGFTFVKEPASFLNE
jgi:hypothetical protein